ncbi:MAG: hypothetical protein Dasosvirus4_32 [Dasosvirus sp.]|uniref:Uncharacterized protein n=1 Tax=Dasosvirus sp. TaxID=2487764 RepID=A0A3G4ZU32_9VIRU|nr:MAG: hypothetical protein Dasosvirus4_32 [Dasosvirus sp.]
MYRKIVHIPKRMFWILSRSKYIDGRIWKIEERGVFLKHLSVCLIDHKSTENSLADPLIASFKKFEQIDIDNLKKYIKWEERINFTVEYHLFGSPFKGTILFPCYVTNINRINFVPQESESYVIGNNNQQLWYEFK